MTGIANAQAITYRTETDSLGSKLVPNNMYYGIQTLRAVENFPITGIKTNAFPYFIKALAVIKEAVAITNKQQGTLTPKVANAIIEAAKKVATGKYNDQFPIDVIQGGAGTSINMNMNEVVANIALETLGHRKGDYKYIHPNNHAGASQSTNDVYPTAGKIAILWYCQQLIPSLNALRDAFYAKSKEFHGILKIGRTQMQDAVPMTLEQEFRAFGVTINDEIIHLKYAMKSLYGINMGATAIGTGINTKPGYSEAVIKNLVKLTKFPLVRESDLIEATSDAGSFVRVADALKGISIKLTKIANDLRLLSSGPEAGMGDIFLPAVQPGSSIMPGKVNPVIPEAVNQIAFQVIGYSETVDLSAAAGQLQLNAFEPVIFYDIMQSIHLLRQGCFIFKTKCINGIQANIPLLKERVKRFAGIATAVAPYIGYQKAAAIVKEAQKTNRSVLSVLKESKLLTPEQIKKILTPSMMTKPNVPMENVIQSFE